MKKLISLLVFIVALISCRKEPLQWDVDALAPLMNTKLKLQQAIPDSLVAVNDSGLLYFQYSDNLFSLDLDSVLAIPDTSISDEFYLPIGSISLPPGTTFLSDTVNNKYDIAGAKLTLLKIESGKILLTIRHSLEGPTVMEYSIPSATKNGVPFYVKQNVPAASGGNPVQQTYTYDMSGYDFSLTGENNDNYNIISTAYRVYADSNGGTLDISAGDKFNIANTLQGITPSYARGYFGKETVSENGSDTATDFFNQIGGGSIQLEELDVTLNITNEVGIDASVLVNNLTGTNTQNGTSVSLNAPITQQPFDINRATENSNTTPPIDPSFITLPLNAQNSNITEFVSNLPNVLSYELNMTLNPLEDISNTNDFVYKNTGLNVAIDAVAPMHFSSSNLIIIDTSEFEMESDGRTEIERIQGGYLLVNSTNWYPIDFNTQFYLLNENQNIIDSIMPTNAIIPGARVANGVEVLTAQTSQLKIPVTPSQIQNLYQTKSVISRVGFTTTGNENVKLFDRYFLEIRLAADLNYMITVE